MLHTHSVNSTVLSRQLEGDRLLLDGYELQKALHGVTTHEVRVEIPVFDNDQDNPRLADKVQTWLERASRLRGVPDPRTRPLYLGPAHGRCPAPREAFEFLFECELKTRSLRP